jgi:SAM-dependent methyltransferase
VSSDPKRDDWNASYDRRENFVFSASDEVVRFVSRFLRRRVGLDEVIDILPGAGNSKVLDVGCGVGRHLVFGSQMGLQMWGFDLSQRAVDVAKRWLLRFEDSLTDDRVIVTDIRDLPWPDGFFDHALSDSVLDSMSYEIATLGIAQVARVLKPGGYFYCNLIARLGAQDGNDDFAGESIVTATHEHGTVQSYFNEAKGRALLEPAFEVLSCFLHTETDAMSGAADGRWHFVLRRR